MALSPGSRLGPYEILAPIGAGGMGEVYRARDTRLDREVAVKVLPEQVAKDPEALSRFEREARTVAGLNHPHVCALFDVGKEGDVQYAVFELLEGDTLREHLSRGALSPSKAIDLATQMCHGLAAAHAKGIVHRDLKPENLVLTPNGLKILDFGLAKLQPVEPAAGDEDLSKEVTLSAPAQLTSPGTAAGTAAYMSPEQARGEPADPRSDVFAVGVVLFEMLSGERPFRRGSLAETLAALLKEDPPELKSPSGPVPPGLERIVLRCLEKTPENRFQSAHDLTTALEAVSGTSAPVPVATPATHRWFWVGAVGVIAVVAAVAGLWIGWPREPPPPVEVRPITSDPGPEWSPALSPDGQQVAYVKLHEGSLALYVKQIDGGEPLLVSQSELHSFSPVWSPDGQQIAFGRHLEGEDGEELDGVFVVPAIGGTARRLAVFPGHSHGVSWSPDQKSLAFAARDSAEEPSAIFLLSVESGERRRVTTPPAGTLGDSLPRISPDGRTLAFARAEAPYVQDVYVTPMDGGEERRLTDGNHATGGLDWTADGRSVVFASLRGVGMSAFSLWMVPLSGGAPERLPFGDHGAMPSISRAGGRLVYEREELNPDIWRVGGPSAGEEERSPIRLISSTRGDFAARYSPDGQQIALASQRSGANEIWIVDADGTNPRQLTFLDMPLTVGPVWSPDGERIAFTSAHGNNWDVHVVSVSGGFVQRLTEAPSRDSTTGWSRDGEWIYFFSDRSGQSEVWKMPSEGGEAAQLTTQGGTFAMESSDGRFLYFTKGGLGPLLSRPELNRIWRIPVDGGDEVLVLDRPVGRWWTILEEGILFVERGPRPAVLEHLDPSTGSTTRVAVLGTRPSSPGLSVSPDGRWVLYSRGPDGPPESDIILVENFE